MSMLQVIGTKTAIGLGNTSSFLGTGGTMPYSYSVVQGGQGGTINSVDGLYSSPTWANYNSNPNNATDTVMVTDAVGNTATTKILVAPPLILFLDIISTTLNIPRGRCTLYNQKIFQPKDPGLFISVGISNIKIFANSYQYNSTNDTYSNFVNCAANLDVHIISIDNSALFQKELVLASLMSPYSIQQQNANAFSIGRIPAGQQVNDLSEIDGPQLPFHYHFSTVLQYSVPASFNTEVFTEFQDISIVTNP